MRYDEMNAHSRITTAHMDIMRHMECSLLGAVTQVGDVHVGTAVPTAGTNGRDVHYNEKFVLSLRLKQLRALVLHENWHKGLHHCTEYTDLQEKYPRLFNMAADYVVNGLMEAMDPEHKFFEWPDDPAPLLDPRFDNMSLPSVLRKLVDEEEKEQGPGKPKPGQGSGSGNGKGRPMDEHMPPPAGAGGDGEGEGGDGGLPGPGSLKQQINDALHQGVLVQARLRGTGGGGCKINGALTERDTDWRTPLRRFIEDKCEGDDSSTYSPRNRMYVPHDICMPTHFSEMMGELIIAADTSGSMTGLYPVVFGEVARICQSVLPDKVRVIWWSDGIEGEEEFTPKDYANMAKLMHPKGGGGTTVNCVAQYILKQRYKPRAVIILTDGYIESRYTVPEGPVLWGVVDNEAFIPLKGTKLNISSRGERG